MNVSGIKTKFTLHLADKAEASFPSGMQGRPLVFTNLSDMDQYSYLLGTIPEILWELMRGGAKIHYLDSDMMPIMIEGEVNDQQLARLSSELPITPLIQKEIVRDGL